MKQDVQQSEATQGQHPKSHTETEATPEGAPVLETLICPSILPPDIRRAARRIRARRERGFSILEIMVVILLIGMLVAIIGPNVMGSHHRGQRGNTQIQICKLEEALNMYKIHTGHYPSSGQGLKVLIESNVLGMRKLPKDPWGRHYIYRAPNLDGEAPRIFSLGADGREGGEGRGKDIDCHGDNKAR